MKYLIGVWTSVVMAVPESLTFLLLVVLGYALTRVVDLVCDWLRGRLHGAPGLGFRQSATDTARQRLMERQGNYLRFRRSVNETVSAAVNQGHGNYGMLYQIRDAYGDVLRHSPTGVSQAADSVIRCVTLLVNLGPSDQRYAMFTRSLAHFDAECGKDDGRAVVPPGPSRLEFSVIGDEPRQRPDKSSDSVDPQPESDSESAPART